MSIHEEPEFKRYWNTGPIYPYHLIRDWMSCNRFEALHYQFRVLDPTKESSIWEQVSVFLVLILYYISTS